MGLRLQANTDVFNGAGYDGVGNASKCAREVVLAIREAGTKGARGSVGGFETPPCPVEGAKLYGYLVCLELFRLK